MKLIAGVVCCAALAADEIPKVGVCKAMAQAGARVRIAALAQSIPEGLVIVDRGCTIYKRRKTKIPAMVLVDFVEFASEEVRAGYNQIAPALDAPFVKVVIEGRIECKPDIHFNVTDEGEAEHGNGYGALGLYVCRMTGARLESWTRAKK